MDITVGIGEMKISADTKEKLVTYSLGTCLGMTIYDPVAKVGGMIHCQLPQSSVNPKKALDMPGMFIDTGVPLLFEKAYALGAQKSRIIVKIAGCNTNGDSSEIFKIGERNRIMIRKLMWKNNLFIAGEDTGGMDARTMSLQMSTGEVTIKSGSNISTL